MFTDPNFAIRLVFGFLIWLGIFLVVAIIITKFTKKRTNGAKAFLWCLGVFFVISVILFIRAIFLGRLSEYNQGQSIGIMIFGFGIPYLVAHQLHKRFIKKHSP